MCGDGILQYSEACDDGNTSDDDFCKGDCSAVTSPQGSVTVTTFSLRGASLPAGKIPLVYHAPIAPRPCGTYVGSMQVAEGAPVVGVAPMLCIPEGRRFLLVLTFYKPQGWPNYDVLTSSRFLELDERDKEIGSWDLVGDVFANDKPPIATITRDKTERNGIVTGVDGTISIDATGKDGSRLRMTGRFSFSKLAPPSN